MIYRPNALATTEKLREIPQEAVADFPYIAIESDLERYADRCSSWHWHDYFEFAVVSGGEMELCTQRQALRIADGEGYFVNSNVLHLCRVADGSDRAQLQVHQFDGSLIAGSTAVLQRYVQPVADCAALDAVHLTPDDPAQARILRAISHAFSAAGAEGDGYELSISNHLLQAWQELYELVRSTVAGTERASQADVSRIKGMLAYIHAHYAEPITVPMIAQSAGVCTRESFRCFRQVLDTTPTLYLMRHRVNAAARLLVETERSITDIALACGFSGPSYFCKVFHDIIGQPPREFRRQRGS